MTPLNSRSRASCLAFDRFGQVCNVVRVVVQILERVQLLNREAIADDAGMLSSLRFLSKQYYDLGLLHMQHAFIGS